jgi:hypothetical protein
MSKPLLILVAGMIGVAGLLTWAGAAGLGIRKPAKNPPSVREGSQRLGRTGHYRSRYFMGGGIHHGK